MGVKETVKDNLVRLRREHKLTQLELSEKINYSDKAISRWETGEVTPDVETLEQLARLYEIPITAFFLPPDKATTKKEKAALKRTEKAARKAQKKQEKLAAAQKKKEAYQKDPARVRRAALLIFCLTLLWTAALSLFFILNGANISFAFCTFIWAVPATFLLLCAFLGRRHPITLRVLLSLFMWCALVATYIQTRTWSLFPLLFLGIPLEAVILLAPFLRRKS